MGSENNRKFLKRKVLGEIKKINRKSKLKHFKIGSISTVSSGAYYILNGIISIIGLPSWKIMSDDPGIKELFGELGGVPITGGTPLNEHSKMNLKLAFKNSYDYKKAVKIINQRLKFLNMFRKKIKKDDNVNKR